MSGVNKVIIVGNMGQDPELRAMPNGTAVCNFSLATSETWKDKQTGEKQEATEWHSCTAFAKRAEAIGQYCKKGSKLYVEGRLKTRSWDDKDTGVKRFKTEIHVDQFQFLDSKSGGQPQHSAPEQSQPGFDDDIPF